MNKWLKKGAMFGLDARIALAVLAMASLAVGLSQETEIKKSKTEQAELQLELYEKNFMKHWEKVSLSGFFSEKYVSEVPLATFYSNDVNYDSSTKTSYFNYYSKLSVHSDQYSGTTHTSTRTLRDRKTDFALTAGHTTDPSDFFYNYVLGIHDYDKQWNDIFEPVNVLYQRINVSSQLLLSLYFTREDLGYKHFTTTLDVPTRTITPTRPLWALGEDPYGNSVRIYYIVDHTVNTNNIQEKVVYFILYSHGENGVLDSTLPVNLDEFYTFTAEGDDIVRIFNDKNLYAKMKIESNNRLEEIKDRILSYAENAYIDRLSLCASEATVSASCDLNSDGKFDNKDENLLLNLNPFPKSDADSTATYLDTTNRFNSTAYLNNPNKTFLSFLGLPEYYSVDLFGNQIRYDSNIGDRSEGPFTMEVWY